MKRRDLIKSSLTMPFMLSELFSIVSMSMMQNAFSQTKNTPIKNYLGLWMGGGAERWWFDGILTPNGSGDDIGSGGAGVFNAFKSYSDFSMEYRTTNNKINGKYHLPYLWESTLSDINNSDIAMTSLANNFATIRGVHTGLTFDAHSHNTRQMQKPLPHQSIAGAIADTRSNSPIAAIISAQGNFASSIGITPVSVPNSAHDIFSGMMLKQTKNSANNYANSPSSFLGIQKLDSMVETFISDLKATTPKRKMAAVETLLDNRKTAVDMILKGFAGIESDYNNAYNRYTQIISSILMPPDHRKLVGLEDNPLRGDNYLFDFDDKTPLYYKEKGIWDGFRYASCRAMAGSFAKAEVYLKNGISRCLQLDITGINDMVGDREVNKYQGFYYDFDVHTRGALLRTGGWTRYYQSLAGCLLHFREQTSKIPGVASGKSIWDETLIHLSSEFNRKGPRGIFGNDPKGTDHNINACSESFFSGSIKEGPIVVGNIYDKFGSNSRCVGDGAPISELGAVADSKHIFSTIGELSGYEGSRNHRPLLKIDNDSIKANVEEPKNIKNS